MKSDDSMHQPKDDNKLDEHSLEVTRAYEQGLKDARRKANENPEASSEKKGSLLSDLSVPQVTAGALAAVTSMLLTNQIGIAGSVIGVAVGSVVSTVASSIYKRVVATGASTIKEKIISPEEGSSQGQHLSSETGTKDVTGARIAPEELRQKVHAQQAARTHKKVAVGVIVVAVVAALAGVLISAGFVSLATAGQGLGTKTSWVAPKVQEESDSNASGDAATQGQPSTSQPNGSTDTPNTNNPTSNPSDTTGSNNPSTSPDGQGNNQNDSGANGTDPSGGESTNGSSPTDPAGTNQGTTSGDSSNGGSTSGGTEGTGGSESANKSQEPAAQSQQPSGTTFQN